MNGKHVGLAAVVVACMSVGLVRGQFPPPPITAPPPDLHGPEAAFPPAYKNGTTIGSGATIGYGSTPESPPIQPPSPGNTGYGVPGNPVQPETGPHHLSTWITYTNCPECAAPFGGNGPVLMELYARTGPSFLIWGPTLNPVLQNGWMVEGGARSMFFNVPMDRAWTIDFGLSETSNHGTNPDQHIILHGILVPKASAQNSFQQSTARIPTLPVTVRYLSRTFVNLSGGREWYLWGCANSGANNLRVGFDAGGRYGTANLGTHELPHRTDVIGGLFIAVHSDIEIPRGACIFYAGLRAEYDYIWSDILQSQNNADMQDINFLMTFGVRF